jgi:molybdopterin synthase catalytic subunit
LISITHSPIDVSQILENISDVESIGATAIFLGSVRGHTEKKSPVHAIYYEAYKEMAEKILSEIEEEAFSLWKISKFAAIHRIGYLNVKEVSVVVAVSSPHRKESLEACKYGIENIKSRVPIWKKEMSQSGSSWIGAF